MKGRVFKCRLAAAGIPGQTAQSAAAPSKKPTSAHNPLSLNGLYAPGVDGLNFLLVGEAPGRGNLLAFSSSKLLYSSI
jgi:hypothetical protein